MTAGGREPVLPAGLREACMKHASTLARLTPAPRRQRTPCLLPITHEYA